jgi:hypothetical protein
MVVKLKGRYYFTQEMTAYLVIKHHLTYLSIDENYDTKFINYGKRFNWEKFIMFGIYPGSFWMIGLVTTPNNGDNSGSYRAFGI